MSWYYIYDSVTGNLKSETSINPSGKISANYDFTIKTNRMRRNQMWDIVTRDLVDRPQKVLLDRVKDFKADAGFRSVWQILNPDQKIKLSNSLIRILGTSRFRNEDSKPGIGDQ